MNKLIFFVDDDKMILNFLEYTLNNREDYDVRTYERGEDCLRDLKLNPDMIVLDHFFEKTSEKYQTGMDILLELKRLAPQIPVIILSSLEDKDLMAKYLKNGADRYIAKNDYFINTLMEVFDLEFN